MRHELRWVNPPMSRSCRYVVQGGSMAAGPGIMPSMSKEGDRANGDELQHISLGGRGCCGGDRHRSECFGGDE
jgi:hypothetical protein